MGAALRALIKFTACITFVSQTDNVVRCHNRDLLDIDILKVIWFGVSTR